MVVQEIANVLEQKLLENADTYFSYAWRDKIGEFLKEESKYARLVDWIEKQIEFCNNTKDVFSPADRNENTTVNMVNSYCELMKNLAILTHCKMLLLDNRTTVKMRENIEYTICKLYKISYNEELKKYV